MSWQLQYTARARRDLRKLPVGTARRVIRGLHSIREDPYNHIKKLEGTNPGHPVYTYRIGLSYRAILSVHDEELVVLGLEVEDRSKAYRDF
jgi:mRNA interferase RelE/StbE